MDLVLTNLFHKNRKKVLEKDDVSIFKSSRFIEIILVLSFFCLYGHGM